MCKELEGLKMKFITIPNIILIGIFIFAVLLILFPMMVKADTVSSNSTQGNIAFEVTTSAWYQPTGANLSLSTSAGTTIIIGSIEARLNSTGGKLLGRIKRDGVEITRTNLTEIVYITNSPIIAVFNETIGTHTYGLELYSPNGKKTFVNNWTLGVTSITNGAYITQGVTNDTVQINISQVNALQDIQDAQNITTATKTTLQNVNLSADLYKQNASNLSGTINYSVIPALPESNVSGLVVDLANIRTNDTNQASFLNLTFSGSSIITTIGTIITGTWHGVGLADLYINSSSIWNAFSTSKWNKTDSILEANLTLNYPTHAQNHTINGTDHTGNLNFNRISSVMTQDENISSSGIWNTLITSKSNKTNISEFTGGKLDDSLLHYSLNSTNTTVTANLANWNATNQTAVRLSINSSSGMVLFSNSTGFITDIINLSAQIPREHVTGQGDVDNTQNASVVAQASYDNSTFIRLDNTSVIPKVPDSFDGNGLSINFTISKVGGMINGTSRVYVNGVLQRRGATGSYIEHSTFIEFASAPPLYDMIEVDYA